MTHEAFYIAADDPPAKKRILEEGLRLFAAWGLSATSIRDIAAATGYSNPALYKHFKTKEALACLLFERSYKELMGQITRAVQTEQGFTAQFRAYIGAFVRFYDAHPHALIFVSDNLAALWPQVSDRIGARTIVTVTRELLERGREEGVVDHAADRSLQVVLIVGALGQLIRQLYLQALDGQAADHAPGLERMLRAGLAPP